MKKVYFLPLFILLLSFSQCKKNPPVSNEPSLPDITTSGANTFGCLVNDELFLPYKNTFNIYLKTIDVSYYPGTGLLNITGNQISQDRYILKSVSLSANSVFGQNTYPLYQAFYSDADIMSCNPAGHFNLDSTLDNTLVITKFDTQNRIISGLFNFTTSSGDCPPYEITEGRFDVQY